VFSYWYFSLQFCCSLRCDQEIAFVAANGLPTVGAEKILPRCNKGYFATGYIVISLYSANRREERGHTNNFQNKQFSR
jgi:hypothetical protein